MSLRGSLQHAEAADKASGETAARLFLIILLWLLTTAVLSAPTVIYVITLYLPTDNSFGIDASSAKGLRHGVPFVLAFVNSTLLPLLARLIAKCVLRHSAVRNGGVAALTARMLLVGRLLTTIVIPIVTVLLGGQGCGEPRGARGRERAQRGARPRAARA